MTQFGVPEGVNINSKKLDTEVERIAHFKQYIFRGGQMIKNGQYVKAKELFVDNTELLKVGYRKILGRFYSLNEYPKPGMWKF